MMDAVHFQVLARFREEIPGYSDKHWNEIPLKLDSDLFYVSGDDVHDALDMFEKKFNVELSEVNWALYFPWENTPRLTQ